MLEAFRGQHLRGLEVDYQLLLGRCLHRKLSRFLAFEDAVDVGGAPVLVDQYRRRQFICIDIVPQVICTDIVPLQFFHSVLGTPASPALKA